MARPGKLSPEQIEQIVALRGSVWSVRRIAELFGVTQSTVQYHLDRNRDRMIAAAEVREPIERPVTQPMCELAPTSFSRGGFLPQPPRHRRRPRPGRIDLSQVPSEMELLAASWSRKDG